MFCSISGEVPQEPVVSRASGLLFEKRLIEKYIKDQGKCPVTGEDLSAEDLLTVQGNKAIRPRPISGTSIPGLLVAFQNEWDEVMLETFTLKQHLDTTRQELAQALYQHDAACRVIARLMQERDEARQQLTHLQVQGPSATVNNSAPAHREDGAVEMSTDDDKADAAKETVGQLQEAVVQDLVATCAQLSAGRKAKKGGAGAAAVVSKEAVKGLAVAATHTPHKADKTTGVTCVAVHSHFHVASGGNGNGNKRGRASSNAGDSEGESVGVVLSGSTDKSVLLTQLDSGKVLAKLTGHTKTVTAVSFHCTASTAASSSSTSVFSASADKTVRMWSAAEGKYSEAWTYKGHNEEVHSLCMQPSGNYLVSVASEGWHFLDVRNGGAFLQGTSNPASAGLPQYTCGAFHPDGLILGTGSSAGSLRIWDVRTLENPHTLPGHAAAMTCLAFSENGYQAASGSSDGSVRLWDLRKLTFTQSLELGPAGVNAVAFDASGAFLAVGGGAGDEASLLQVRTVKDWAPCADLSVSHAKAVTSLAWTAASALVSGALDRTIKMFNAAAQEA